MINTGNATPRLDLLGPILQEGMPEEAYVAHRVLPTLIVQKRTGAIPSFLFSDAQALSIKHAPKTGFAQIQSKLGQANYSCSEAGIEEPLSFEDYEILGRDYAQEVITRKLVHIVLRARDYALSQALFSAAGESTFADNLVTAAATWASSTGDPLSDVLTAKRNVALQTGQPANAMIMGYDLYIDLCKSPAIRTMVRNVLGYSGAHVGQAVPAEIPVAVLAMTFGLDEIIIAPGVVDANGEGAAAKSLGFLWPKTYALVFRKAKNANDVREVALGRTFVYDLASTFNELTTMNVLDTLRALMLEQYPKPDVNCDVLRAREYIDMQVLLPKAGALIKSCG
jgi:hypothetical protein